MTVKEPNVCKNCLAPCGLLLDKRLREGCRLGNRLTRPRKKASRT